MPPAAILDIDGTLVDTNYQHAMSWYMAFRQHGVVLPITRIHRHIGMGGDQLVAAVAGEEVEERCGDDIRAAEGPLYLATIQTTSVLEGARELIEDLKAGGRKVVLASSAKEQEVDHYLDLLDARELVDGWTTSRPASLRSAMSSRAPSRTDVLWIDARERAPSAARMSSPQRSSTSSPATAATSWSPPMPM